MPTRPHRSRRTPPTAADSSLAQVRLALAAAQEKLIEDPQLLDVRELTSYTSFLLLVTGRSARQVAAVADHVTETLRRHGRRPLGVEGAGSAEWLLIDYGDFLVHVFQPEARLKYDLDGFWRDAPRLESGPSAPPPPPPAPRLARPRRPRARR